eukprot:12057714-Alexandrium_andersonii.AAC.1
MWLLSVHGDLRLWWCGLASPAVLVPPSGAEVGGRGPALRPAWLVGPVGGREPLRCLGSPACDAHCTGRK